MPDDGTHRCRPVRANSEIPYLPGNIHVTDYTNDY